MTAKQLLTAVLVSATTAVGSVWGFETYQQHQPVFSYKPESSSIIKQAKYSADAGGPTVDFEKAATKAAPAVVHIKVSSKPKQVTQQRSKLTGQSV